MSTRDYQDIFYISFLRKSFIVHDQVSLFDIDIFVPVISKYIFKIETLSFIQQIMRSYLFSKPSRDLITLLGTPRVETLWEKDEKLIQHWRKCSYSSSIYSSTMLSVLSKI